MNKIRILPATNIQHASDSIYIFYSIPVWSGIIKQELNWFEILCGISFGQQSIGIYNRASRMKVNSRFWKFEILECSTKKLPNPPKVMHNKSPSSKLYIIRDTLYIARGISGSLRIICQSLAIWTISENCNNIRLWVAGT